jgi:putative flippase GtrA
LEVPLFRADFWFGAGVVIAVIAVFNIALFVAELMKNVIPVLVQMVKFVAIGSFNTVLDFGILNILIFATDIASGYWYSGFKAISFCFASVNSYFWNKYWTFYSREEASAKEFGKFFIVSGIGFLINVGAASFIVNIMNAPDGFSPVRWANVGAVVATLASLLWNFLGYKFLVFANVQRGNKTERIQQL